MSLEAKAKIRPELNTGEKLLWSGMPRQDFHVQRGDKVLLGLGVFWLFTVVYAMTNAAEARHVPTFVQVWAVPGLLIGAYAFFGRYLVDKYKRARTWYGVTDQRILVITSWLRPAVEKLSLRGLDVQLHGRADGSGLITFGTSPWVLFPPRFDLASDARAVHEIVLGAQKRELVESVRAGLGSDASAELNPRHA